jgi:hypothetical protein
MPFNFEVPRSRLFQAIPAHSVPNPEGELVQANDILISVSFGRITSTDGSTHELIATYNPISNQLEFDVPEHVISFLEKVDFGTRFRRYLDWLFGADLSVAPGASAGDVLVRNPANDTWIPVNVLPVAVSFVAADWGSGTVNEVLIRRAGVPGAGEVGPHGLDNTGPYQVIIYKDVSPGVVEEVDVVVQTNINNGNITLRKSGLAAAFDGRAVIASII